MDTSNLIFTIILVVAFSFFSFNLYRIISNIRLGRDINRSDRRLDRWKNMIRVALGQSKMIRRPIAGVLHIVIYIGFVIVNIEMIEIIIDGVFGSHRFLSSILSINLYNFLIASFEILALLVLVACILFLIRRNIIRIKRFFGNEMTKWPKTDANLILIFEILLMCAFLTMNAADSILQDIDSYYAHVGSFPVSQWIVPLIASSSIDSLVFIERF